MNRVLGLSLILGLTVACAPPSLDPQQNMKFVGMKMYNDKAELQGRNFEVVGTVKGRAYMRGSLFERGHMDMNEAYDLMKRNAVLMGADAILLESVIDIGMTATSFKTTECKGVAIKFKS